MLKEQPLSLELGVVESAHNIAEIVQYRSSSSFLEALRQVHAWVAQQGNHTGNIRMNGVTLLEANPHRQGMEVAYHDPEHHRQIVGFRERQKKDGDLPLPIFFKHEL